jgi:hypothetical protein
MAAMSSSVSAAKVSRSAGQVSGRLLAALGLSAVYTVWTTATDSVDDGFTATEPGVWAFYASMAAVAVLFRTDRLAIWASLAALLPLLLGNGIALPLHRGGRAGPLGPATLVPISSPRRGIRPATSHVVLTD